MSIANYFTLLRIILCPLFLLIYLYPAAFGLTDQTLPYALLSLLTVCELSDISDGWLARRLNQVTELGKLLDPMADSLYRLSIFFTFTAPPIHLPLWTILPFLYRDTTIGTLRIICALKGYTLAARPSGKLKAILQAFSAVLITLLLIPYSEGALSPETLTLTATLITLAAAFYTLFSGIEYLWAHRQALKHIAS